MEELNNTGLEIDWKGVWVLGQFTVTEISQMYRKTPCFVIQQRVFFTNKMLTTAALAALKPFINIVPVNKVPPCINKSRSFILVLQVVCMLPDIYY